MVKSAAKPKSVVVNTQDARNFPLFFERPAALDTNRHAKAGLLPVQDFSFAANTNSIQVNAVEFFEAARQYPIVFTQSELPFPLAIVGLEQQNYFVSNKGQWKEGAYLPAYVRKYPFVFMDVPERNEFVLCIDEAAPQYKENGDKNTVPLFKGDDPSELTVNALEFCTSYHNHHQLTRNFCNDIQAAGLLMPMRSDIKLANGREIALAGFQTIDEKKMSALPEAKVLEFFKKGWLPLIYIALLSASNWKSLVDLASGRENSNAD